MRQEGHDPKRASDLDYARSVLQSSSLLNAKREASQMPMIGVADKVADNSRVMNQHDAQCNGWREGKYG